MNLSAKPWLPLISIAALLIINSLFLLLLISHASKTTAKAAQQATQQSQQMLNQLNAISSQVRQLAVNPATQSFHTVLTAIQQEIATVRQSVVAQQQALQQFTAQIAAWQRDQTAQLHDLRRVVINKDTKQYLTTHDLPFKVLTVDVIAQQPFVSVDYQQHITALQKGDSLAGWQITAIDYSQAEVEFKNAQDQFIRLSLTGGSAE